jgi:hypothetical protein
MDRQELTEMHNITAIANDLGNRGFNLGKKGRGAPSPKPPPPIGDLAYMSAIARRAPIVSAAS